MPRRRSIAAPRLACRIAAEVESHLSAEQRQRARQLITDRKRRFKPPPAFIAEGMRSRAA